MSDSIEKIADEMKLACQITGGRGDLSINYVADWNSRLRALASPAGDFQPPEPPAGGAITAEWVIGYLPGTHNGDALREDAFQLCREEVAHAFAEWNALNAASKPAEAGAMQCWQQIDTAPRDVECVFWIMPKSAQETYVTTSGTPIISAQEPCAHQGKYGSWGSLMKAVLWRPVQVVAPPTADQIAYALATRSKP